MTEQLSFLSDLDRAKDNGLETKCKINMDIANKIRQNKRWVA